MPFALEVRFFPLFWFFLLFLVFVSFSDQVASTSNGSPGISKGSPAPQMVRQLLEWVSSFSIGSPSIPKGSPAPQKVRQHPKRFASTSKGSPSISKGSPASRMGRQLLNWVASFSIGSPASQKVRQYYGRFRLRAFWFQLIGDFADLCPPRSRCSATCGTRFALHYDVYTIGAGGHRPGFAIGSRGAEVSSSRVSPFLTFADLCPPRSRCSATCGTLFALHYDIYTIGAGGHPLRLSLQYAGVPLRGVQSRSIFT